MTSRVVDPTSPSTTAVAADVAPPSTAGVVSLVDELSSTGMAPREERELFLWVLNTTDEERTLHGISTSCGCTKAPGFSPRTLAPGEAMEIRLLVKGAKKATERKRKWVRVALSEVDEGPSDTASGIPVAPPLVLAVPLFTETVSPTAEPTASL